MTNEEKVKFLDKVCGIMVCSIIILAIAIAYLMIRVDEITPREHKGYKPVYLYRQNGTTNMFILDSYE